MLQATAHRLRQRLFQQLQVAEQQVGTAVAVVARDLPLLRRVQGGIEAQRHAREELPEEAAIGALIKKKTAKKKPSAFDVKEKQKIFQALMGRGFPPGLILNKLGRIKKEDIDGEDWE